MAGSPKVGVLTFHRCINYGSYWQARALVEGLRGLGADARILDHDCRRARRAEWRNAFQPVRPQRTARADFAAYGRKARKFIAAVERLPRSAAFALDAPETMERLDVAVVGSDEVWNFRHPWYAGRPSFFGEGLMADRLVAYAASFGCHDAGERLDAPWAERLERFDALSVRDDNSRRLVRDGLGREPALVLDPCLQFAEVCRRPQEAPADFALVYGRGFPAALAQAARRWAKRQGLRLVSVGYRNDWADEQRLDAGPEDFARDMGQARAVITNFFHGCVFALVNDKPFACTLTDYRWHKIAALLTTLDAGGRLVGEAPSEDELNAALSGPTAGQAARRLASLRARSSAYLAHALA